MPLISWDALQTANALLLNSTHCNNRRQHSRSQIEKAFVFVIGSNDCAYRGAPPPPHTHTLPFDGIHKPKTDIVQIYARLFVLLPGNPPYLQLKHARWMHMAGLRAPKAQLHFCGLFVGRLPID